MDMNEELIPTEISVQPEKPETPVVPKQSKVRKWFRQLAAVGALVVSQTQPILASENKQNDPDEKNPTSLIIKNETDDSLPDKSSLQATRSKGLPHSIIEKKKGKTSVGNLRQSDSDTNNEHTGRNKDRLPFPSSVSRWTNLITKVANQAEVDPLIVGAIIQQETNGDPDMIGRDGELGLMQVMPIHVDIYCENNDCSQFEDGNGKIDYTNPELTLVVGTNVFRHEFAASGRDTKAALAGYNGGPVARMWFLGTKTRDDYITHLEENGYTTAQAIRKANVVEIYVNSVTANYEEALSNQN